MLSFLDFLFRNFLFTILLCLFCFILWRFRKSTSSKVKKAYWYIIILSKYTSFSIFFISFSSFFLSSLLFIILFHFTFFWGFRKCTSSKIKAYCSAIIWSEYTSFSIFFIFFWLTLFTLLIGFLRFFFRFNHCS